MSEAYIGDWVTLFGKKGGKKAKNRKEKVSMRVRLLVTVSKLLHFLPESRVFSLGKTRIRFTTFTQQQK